MDKIIYCFRSGSWLQAVDMIDPRLIRCPPSLVLSIGANMWLAAARMAVGSSWRCGSCSETSCYHHRLVAYQEPSQVPRSINTGSANTSSGTVRQVYWRRLARYEATGHFAT